MIVENYKGYMEGADITQIPADFLTFPSKNCLVYKGTPMTRGGMVNDGTASTENTKVHSEYVWKKAPGGPKSLRVWGTTLQVKWGGMWITLFTGFTAGTTRVRFASWVDTNGSIIKSRLFMVDGSDKVYEWNGAIATIASNSGTNVVISGTPTLLQLGFDPGNTTAQNVKIVKHSAGAVTNITEYAHTDALSGNDDVTLGSIPSPAAVAGDFLIASVVTHTSKLTGVDKDEIYNYKNHLFVANFDSGRIYYSHATTKLEFTIPGTKTAITADLLDLDGLFTAMIERKGILWISTTDDWFKVTKTVEVNAYGYWTNVEKFEQAESTGARPFAVGSHKGDVIFMGQDKSLRRITSLEIVGTDEIQLISDKIDGLLLRLELDDVRIYYHQRYIFVISANEGITVMLDVIQGEFMPPQYIGMSCMSVIEGVRYGHSNARNETFELFTGRSDLGAQIEAVIAPGYQKGEHGFRYKQHSMFGIHARGTLSTKVRVEHFYEESGAKAEKTAEFQVSDVKLYEVPDDVSFGSQALATRSFAGVDDEAEVALKPFFLFDKYEMISWFNYRPVFTIYGDDAEFHLIGWHIDDAISPRKIGNDLFLDKG